MMDFPLFPPFYPLPKQTASSVLTALQQALQLVRETLIKLIKERGGNAKAIAGLFLHAAIRVRS